MPSKGIHEALFEVVFIKLSFVLPETISRSREAKDSVVSIISNGFEGLSEAIICADWSITLINSFLTDSFGSFCN